LYGLLPFFSRGFLEEKKMTSDEEKILKVAKEVVIKFIETGRISPSGFSKYFEEIYQSIKDTVKEGREKQPKQD